MSAPGPARARAPAPPAPIDPAARPALPRGVRVRWDAVRQGWVLLAPERALRLDQIGVAILERADGARSFADIVADLAAAYDAPPERIAADAGRFLSALAARRMIELRP